MGKAWRALSLVGDDDDCEDIGDDDDEDDDDCKDGVVLVMRTMMHCQPGGAD